MGRRVPTEDTLLYGGRATVEFHRGKHYYTVSVPEMDLEHVYQPGVTTIIGIKDKSGPLCWWTAEQCELYAQRKIDELMDQSPGIEALPIEKVLRIARDMKSEYRNVKRIAGEVGTVVHSFLHSYLEAQHRGEDANLILRPTPFSDEMPESSTIEMCERANASISAGLEWFGKHKLVPMRMETPVWSPTHGYIGTDDFIGYVDEELCVVDYKSSKDLYPEVWLQTAAYQRAYEEEFPHLKIEARWGVNVGKDGQLTAIRRGREFLLDDFAAFRGARQLFEWDRVYGQGKDPFEIIGPLGAMETGDWIDELQAEAA